MNWFRAHSNDVYINLVAGVLASLIVLLCQTAVKTAALILASLITIKWQIRLCWRIHNPQRIYVVSGAITDVGEHAKAAILAGPDAEAANTLIATIGLIYPKAQTKHVYSSAFPLESYKEDLVVVGGPVNNNCSKLVLDTVKDYLYFNEEFQMILPGQSFETVYDTNNKPLKDYGAIIRLTNPFIDSKEVISAVGCDTYGVLAAAHLISSRPDAKSLRVQLRKQLGWRNYFLKQDYIAIVECEVLGNDVGHISLKHLKILNRSKETPLG